MMKRRRSFSALSVALLLTIVSAGCSNLKQSSNDYVNDPSILASFGQETLSIEAFERQYLKSVGSVDRAAGDSLAAYEDFLTRFVDFRLKVLDAHARGLADDPEVQEEIREYRAQLARPYLIENAVMDSLLRQLYDRQLEEIHVSHIMVMVDEVAAPEDSLAAFQRLQAAVDELDAGASFADVALERSEDPSARQNRGSLGYVTGGQLVHHFEDVMYSTPVGGRSHIFRSPFGFHVLQVHDRRVRRHPIRASHILIRPEDDSAEAQARALARMQEIRQRILEGEDFGTLAKQYSQDPGSAENGGDLSTFGPGRMIEPFEEAAYSLKEIGDISEVVETQFGYHLIKLTDRQAAPAYEESLPQLKQLMQRLPRAQDAEQRLGARFRHAHGSRVDTALLDEALAAFPEEGILAAIIEDGFPEAYGERTFAWIAETGYSFDDFTSYLRSTRAPTHLQHQRMLTDMMIERYLNQRAVDVNIETLEQRDEQFRALMDDYRAGILMFKASEETVWEAASADSAALLSHYNANSDRYRFPERIRLITFQSPSDSTLKRVEAMLAGGASVETIIAAVGETQGLQIDTTLVANQTNSVFDRAFSLQDGEHTQPAAHQRGHILLLRTGTEPPRAKTFDEARAEVVNDYQKVLEDRWLERLRNQYRVRLFPERLRSAFASTVENHSHH